MTGEQEIKYRESLRVERETTMMIPFDDWQEVDPSSDREIKIDLMLSGMAGKEEVEWLVGELRSTERELQKLQGKVLEVVPFAKARDTGIFALLAEQGVLIGFDSWHHAPLCPMNNWAKQSQPRGWCSCGAAVAWQK